MKDKYNDLTPSERDAVSQEFAEKELVKKMMSALKKKAKGGKLLIDFRSKPTRKTIAKFVDEKAIIVLGKDSISIPPFINEHFLCRAMFHYSAGEVIDWSVVYEQITGYIKEQFGKPVPTRQNWRMVYDAMTAVNKRFQNKFDEDLFAWKEKTIKRLR